LGSLQRIAVPGKACPVPAGKKSIQGDYQFVPLANPVNMSNFSTSIYLHLLHLNKLVLCCALLLYVPMQHRRCFERLQARKVGNTRISGVLVAIRKREVDLCHQTAGEFWLPVKL
jgi:hypothetical protein